MAGEKRPLQLLGPSRCIRYACLETVHFLRNDVFRDILVDESIIRVQFCLGFLNSRCQVVNEYCKEYWSQVGPLRGQWKSGGILSKCRFNSHSDGSIEEVALSQTTTERQVRHRNKQVWKAVLCAILCQTLSESQEIPRQMRSLCLVFEATCLVHRQAVVWLTVLGESQTGGRSGACSSTEMRRAFCFGLHPGPLRLLVKVTPDGSDPTCPGG